MYIPHCFNSFQGFSVKDIKRRVKVFLAETIYNKQEKFEILDKDTLNSTWNHDVVVYQLFNEISSSGIYDESGLTMNQYIKIRDFFVKGNKII